MDLNEVKKFINDRRERVILVEGGNPTMVLLSYEDYKRISDGDNTKSNILDVKDHSGDEAEDTTESDLTLDDLPF